MGPSGIPARTAGRPPCWTENLRTLDRELSPQPHPLLVNNPMALQMADLFRGNLWSMEIVIRPTMSLRSRRRPRSYRSRSRMRPAVFLQTLIAWHQIRSPANRVMPPHPPHLHTMSLPCQNRRTLICDSEIHCRFQERLVFDEKAQNAMMMLRIALAECHRRPASDARQSVLFDGQRKPAPSKISLWMRHRRMKMQPDGPKLSNKSEPRDDVAKRRTTTG